VRVVIDTNVFVSSTKGGNPREIIDLVDQGKLILCVSEEIVTEYVRIFHRLRLSQNTIERLLLFCEEAETVEVVTSKLNIVKEDPDDDKFIECAVSLNAEYIITGDKALRAIGQYQNIIIVTPKEFLDSINEH
jgi:putative PIN family toxin of toxin-antitoxin system